MSLEVKGKVFKIKDKVTGKSKNGTWVKQEFIVETNGEYPKKIAFSAWGDKTDIVSSLRVGEPVTVSFNAESREYNENWYTDLRAWKIGREQTQQATTSVPPAQETQNDSTQQNDDLPF